MGFAVHKHTQAGVKDLDPTLYVLGDGAGTRATIWPALGFNCLAWQVPHEGQTLDLLYTDPAVFDNGRPTRSGIPVLFPFPNRIRAGRFTWDGKEYQLPLNDGTKQNAIHGFACRHPWRVVEQGADATRAWLTGEFQGSTDAPECASLWPADYRIRLTYQLAVGELSLLAEVTNPDSKPLPFGLGYHPYFRLPFASGGRAEDCQVQVKARSFWVLHDSLPTGERQPVDAGRDLNTPRRFTDLQVDDVLTDLAFIHDPAERTLARSTLWGVPGRALQLFCSDAFREMVIFTPPHRQAFCVEPYTCTTDAINLQARGIEAGWLVLPPGKSWRGTVELRI